MQSVVVQEVHKGEEMPASVRHSMQEMFQEIRRRAFSLFERRGCVHGRDGEDWLQAERDVIWAPDTGLIEREDEFRAHLLVDGLEAGDLCITALPDAILVQAEAGCRREAKWAARTVRLSEKRLFRRLDLPSGIDVDKVTATLDNGTLCITAPKAEQSKLRALAVAA
ncbi:MAG TPA: Hsp20 family protein [Bryobacterales bacterium]|nr:Hsp20 family protein [Bryobacterales bacterium]